MTLPIDPLKLAAALIRCPSVTPADAGALGLLEGALIPLGFTCLRMPFSEAGTASVDNLYAKIGSGRPHFSFAGHTDVVPVGDSAAWTADPFGGAIKDGLLYGRGAADMKAAIAAFAAAAGGFLKSGAPFGTISLLITGDEEGASVNGTVKMLRALKDMGETIDDCLVGEPTSRVALGDMVKIGRRGSLSAHIRAYGTQGHVAYPKLADNPLPRLLDLLMKFDRAELDRGTEHFEPSNLEIVTIDVGNTAPNIIPAEAYARFNIRFNDRHTQASLRAWIEEEVTRAGRETGARFKVTFSGNGEAFVTQPGAFTDLLVSAIGAETGRTPELSTSGGTSDARFIKDVARVAEFGLVGETAHKVDEHVAAEDVRVLTKIYERVLAGYFKNAGTA